MNAFLSVCDWVASLNPYALAALVVMVMGFLGALAVAAFYFYLAAASGAGESNEGEVETHTPDSICLRSVCAWCEPGAKGTGITHGICPAHAEQLKREAGL
jgi:hypothetical protein